MTHGGNYAQFTFGECFICTCHRFYVLWWKNKRFRTSGVAMLEIYRGKKCGLCLSRVYGLDDKTGHI